MQNMSGVQISENEKVEPFFQKLSTLAADVENGVKEVQKKISLPKSDLPENSALIASVQLLDSLVALKEEINDTEEEFDKTECDRENFMDSFRDAVKDTERKLDELENILKKYGYVPWEPHQEVKEEPARNAEDAGDSQDAVPITTEEISPAQTDEEKPGSERSSTPMCSSRALTNILRSSRSRVRNGAPRYNIDDITPQLKLRRSCRTGANSQLITPICFSDDVVCTPGLFIPFQKKCLKNGTLVSPDLYRSTFFPSRQYMNERENIYRNANSPQFSEEDVTIELFKKSYSYNHQKQKESITPEEPITHHIIEEIQKYRRERKMTQREQSITPEEPTVHAQKLIDEIQKSTRKNFKKEKSVTPEEPILHVEQLLEDIRKSNKKNIASRIPIRDENTTPESPKLKTFALLEKSKIYQSFLHQKS